MLTPFGLIWETFALHCREGGTDLGVGAAITEDDLQQEEWD